MADDLEVRLQSHAKAFEGLMSLLPPDLYYGKQNTENEWMKKKQTKEEKKAARRAKLNPANHKTAADIANERDRKRTLEDEEAERAAAGLDGPLERPGEGMSKPKSKAQKTARGQDVHSRNGIDVLGVSTPLGVVNKRADKEAQREAKEQRRKEKQARKSAKAEKTRLRKHEKSATTFPSTGTAIATEDIEDDEELGNEETETQAAITETQTDIDAIDVSGLVDESPQVERQSSSRSASPDPEFSPYYNERASSSSSIPALDDAHAVPSALPGKQSIKLSQPPTDDQHETPQQAKARKDAQIAKLHALIEAKRKARNADGLNGKPARSRSELIEARRQKQQELKEKKKALRVQERDKLKKEEFEAHLASLRGSPVLGSELFAPRSRSASVSSPGIATAYSNNFSFGRVAFADGSRLNATLSSVDERKKQKGPQDTKTALLAAEKHQARLNGLDASKRAELADKDMWLSARKRISGEKVHDDVSLLKKSLKRTEKAKSRSEKEWGERLEGVKRSQEARQKKREENIAKRREEKGKPKGARTGAKTGSSAGKKKAKKRAGFEGTFRGRA